MRYARFTLVFLASVFAAALLIVYAFPYLIGVPQHPLPKGAQKVIYSKLAAWGNQNPGYNTRMSAYSASGDYLGYGSSICKESARNKFDKYGVLQRVVGNEQYYHPVLSAQCGLKSYGQYLSGRNDQLEALIANANNLITLQGADGALRYPFSFRYYLTGQILNPGWVSGMAQGQALSLYSRAYYATKDSTYIEAGRKALAFMQIPTSNGGVMTTLEDYSEKYSNEIFFEEYVSTPANYTLNGYIFALIGIYDWSQIDPSIDADQDIARDLFNRGVRSLKILLPHYDLGKISSYDLGYLTVKGTQPHISKGYHGVHIYLLNAMYSITGDSVFSSYRDRWTLYMNPYARAVSMELSKRDLSWPLF